MLGPSHWLPPFFGRGLSHDLDRTCSPLPHGSEHSPHFDQFCHPPSTTSETFNESRQTAARSNIKSRRKRSKWRKKNGNVFMKTLTVLCCNLVQACLVSDSASVAFLTPHNAKRTRHSDGLPAFTHWVTHVVVGTVASVLEVHGQVS